MKGFLLDMDGTLLDSMPVWRTLGLRYLQSIGVEATPDLADRIAGMSTVQALAWCREQYGIERDPQQMQQEVHALLSHSYRNDIALKPGVLAALDTLDRHGVAVAVATATPDALAKEALARHGLLDRFRFVQTVPNTGHAKDTAAFWEEGCRRLGTKPSETVAVEDAVHAMEGAKLAGCFVIAVREDTMSKADIQTMRSQADLFLETWEDFTFPLA